MSAVGASSQPMVAIDRTPRLLLRLEGIALAWLAHIGVRSRSDW